ncbi:Uncharacterised protein [uncultured archaeon]|nr:Uncharacterised protein [uncultured archaeon]
MVGMKRKAAFVLSAMLIISIFSGIAFSAATGLAEPKISSTTHPTADWSKNNKPRFTWESVAGATKYEYSMSGTPDEMPASMETTLLEAYFTNSNDGEKYFNVAACDDSNCGPAGHYLVRIDVTPPLPPENPAGTPGPGSAITLSWPVPSDASGISAYNIFRNNKQKTGSNDFMPNDGGVKKFSSDTNYFIDREGLVGGKDYYYRIQAVDKAGNIGPAGRILRVTAPLPDQNVPAPPAEPKDTNSNTTDSNAPAQQPQGSVTPPSGGTTPPEGETSGTAPPNPETGKSYGEQEPQQGNAGKSPNQENAQTGDLTGTAILLLIAAAGIAVLLYPKMEKPKERHHKA